VFLDLRKLLFGSFLKCESTVEFEPPREKEFGSKNQQPGKQTEIP